MTTIAKPSLLEAAKSVVKTSKEVYLTGTNRTALVRVTCMEALRQAVQDAERTFTPTDLFKDADGYIMSGNGICVQFKAGVPVRLEVGEASYVVHDAEAYTPLTKDEIYKLADSWLENNNPSKIGWATTLERAVIERLGLRWKE
jgi:hypothetical protein